MQLPRLASCMGHLQMNESGCQADGIRHMKGKCKGPFWFNPVEERSCGRRLTLHTLSRQQNPTT